MAIINKLEINENVNQQEFQEFELTYRINKSLNNSILTVSIELLHFVSVLINQMYYGGYLCDCFLVDLNQEIYQALVESGAPL